MLNLKLCENLHILSKYNDETYFYVNVKAKSIKGKTSSLIGSSSPPGGYQVDGLPPAYSGSKSNSGSMLIVLVREDGPIYAGSHF